MPQPNYRRLVDYYDPHPSLSDRVKELGDPSSFPDHRSPGVNDAVMGLVVKYFSEYMGIDDSDPSRLSLVASRAVKAKEEKDIRALVMASLRQKLEGKTDYYGVQSLADISASAALVKEIAFGSTFDAARPNYIAADLGSGTGILSAAMAIAGLRAQVRTTCLVLVDSQKEALDRSKHVLEQCTDAVIHPIQADLRNSEVFRSLVTQHVQVDNWTSETFGAGTPPMKRLNRNEVVWSAKTQAELRKGSHLDPYQYVLNNLITYTRDFYDCVKHGVSAFFPDAVNGLFVPNFEKTSLRLKTGPTSDHLGLDQIASEFARYEDFGLLTRWGEDQV